MQVVGSQVSVAAVLDCAVAQHRARALALELGFALADCEEIVLSVAELASNVVRHAGRGVLIFRPLEREGRVGIEIEAEDHGPGIKDIEHAFADGYSSAGGLGYGLGTVNRLMDEVEVTSTPTLGTRILCRQWIRSKRAAFPVWDAGAATRSRGGAPENGDAFVIREWEGKLIAGVIDGLGHGAPAQQAALSAQSFVRSHYELSLEKMFVGVSRACRGTRGVVMAVARFEAPCTMILANLGNVEVRAWSADERFNFAVKRGILGVGEARAAVQCHHWERSWVLVLHSDGLRTRWQWSDFPGLERQPAQVITDTLLKELAKEDDDATVVTVKG